MDRYSERDLEMWRLYVRGRTQDQIAKDYGTYQVNVSRALKRVKDSIGTEQREDLIFREYAFLDRIRSEILEIWDSGPAPVTAGKDGEIVLDPETGEPVRDHTGRLRAVETAGRFTDRMHDLMGLKAALKVEGTVTGSAAMEELAAAAMERLARASEDL